MTQPLHYWEGAHVKTQPRVLKLGWQITGAVTISALRAGLPVLTTFGAISAQATIDNWLNPDNDPDYTSEFLVAAYDATSMGADAFGGLVRMGGQCKAIDYMHARCWSGTEGTTVVDRFVLASSALTASTLATEIAVGAHGNIGFKVNFGNTPDFDGLTAGFIMVEIGWISK